MILMNCYTVSIYKSSTTYTLLGNILATLILGTSRFRSSSIKLYFNKYISHYNTKKNTNKYQKK